MKDWTGNMNSIYKTIGASNHTENERQVDDYYATDPIATKLLLEKERFSSLIWEPACGEGHIAKVFEEQGYKVLATDLIYRGFGQETSRDFLKTELKKPFMGDIVTNPPYKYAQEFVQKSLDLVEPGHKVAMFLKLTFLEGQKRRELFDKYPPKVVYVFSKRVACAMNGDFKNISSSAVAYAWFVWEKGYTGEPVIRWIN